MLRLNAAHKTIQLFLVHFYENSRDVQGTDEDYDVLEDELLTNDKGYTKLNNGYNLADY